MSSSPIIRLGQTDFFMPVGFNLAEAIYESPFFWMVTDEHYQDQAAGNRGRATEEIAARLLSPVFGDRLYTNAVVLDGTTIVHEIDVLALVGNRALAIQAKAKRLTVLSRQGNDQQVTKDFSQAVQEAYEQGVVSRRLLLGPEHNLLDSDGKPIDRPESIEDAYIICLTLDHFPALPSMINTFLEKQPGSIALHGSPRSTCSIRICSSTYWGLIAREFAHWRHSPCSSGDLTKQCLGHAPSFFVLCAIVSESSNSLNW